MSRPTAISPEEQEQIARRIGVLLLQAAPDDWQQITVEYRATGEHQDMLAEIVSQDESSRSWEPPEELLSIFEHLREGMYRPEVGTWLSALYVVERPSSYRIDINFDSEPRWTQPLPNSAYAEELRQYPRTDENIPDWMRDYLDASESGDMPPEPDAMGVPAEYGTDPSPSAPPDVDTTPEPAIAPEQGTPLPTRRPARPDQPPPEIPPAAVAAPFVSDSDGVRNDVPPTPAAFTDTPPAASLPDEPLGGMQKFRTAMVFDDFDEQGRPVVANRAPVPPDELPALRQYLENAPIVLASRDDEQDQLDPEQPASVPSTWHTDGSWLWPGSVAFYLARYGMPPQPELVEHVRRQNFALGEIDDQTRDAAVSELIDQPETDVPGASMAMPEPPREQAPLDPVDDLIGTPGPDVPVDEASEIGRHGFDEPDPDEAVNESNDVLALLHDKLTEYEVDSDRYRIGSHSARANCLVQEGPDWVVTSDDRGGEDLRFSHVDQAAAYLLGNVLLHRPSRAAQPPGAAAVPAAPDTGVGELSGLDSPGLDSPGLDDDAAPTEAGSPATEDSFGTPGQPEPSVLANLPRRATPPSADQPEPEANAGSGGHFLFTANQEAADREAANREAADREAADHQEADATAVTPSLPAQAADIPAPEQAAPDAGPGDSDEATRMHPMPPSPPAGPTAGQPAPPRPPEAGPAPGGQPQQPSPLPKRPARNAAPEQAAPPQPGPPAAPAGQPQGPGAGAPPPQAPPGGQRPPQPPQPNAGREQPIQPLGGEPPLTLYRDRRQVVLQPGTELDRFGDPAGNVTYAIRTPYAHRSLPPQWATRPYVAYRLQRPLQVLRGAAVPWFEQPGGGTAYVLPAAISELLADGTLSEIPHAEAPRPSME